MTRIASIPSRNGERGIALVVVLILLLVMSMLALVSLRSTLMEERMSANMADRSESFQAAEAALRQGEQLASGKPAMPGAGACLNGLCGIPNAGATTPNWAPTSAVWNTARVADIDFGQHAVGAKYIVELLATDVNVPLAGGCVSDDVNEECTGLESRYRITALSSADGRATVMLQTNYAVP